ncbi:MAG: roadblock/LC7 domain-containing protein [Thermodesulfobacteriota bacterium]
MPYTLGLAQLDSIEDVLQSDIMNLGVTCVVLIDLSGNIIAHQDTGSMQYAIYSLAALAAGNFGAVSAIAKIIGEEEFSLLFHKGAKENIHFSKVTDGFLLVTVFGKSVSIGSLRMKTAEAIRQIEKILKERTAEQAQPDSAEDAIQYWTR